RCRDVVRRPVGFGVLLLLLQLDGGALTALALEHRERVPLRGGAERHQGEGRQGEHHQQHHHGASGPRLGGGAGPGPRARLVGGGGHVVPPGAGERCGEATITDCSPSIRVRISVADSSPKRRGRSLRRSSSGSTAVPRFLISSTPRWCSRRYAVRRLRPKGITSRTV